MNNATPDARRYGAMVVFRDEERRLRNPTNEKTRRKHTMQEMGNAVSRNAEHTELFIESRQTEEKA